MYFWVYRGDSPSLDDILMLRCNAIGCMTWAEDVQSMRCTVYEMYICKLYCVGVDCTVIRCHTVLHEFDVMHADWTQCCVSGKPEFAKRRCVSE